MPVRTIRADRFGGMDKYAKDASYAVDSVNFSIDPGGSIFKCRGREQFTQAEHDIQNCWSGELGGKKAMVYLAGGILYNTDIESSVTVAEPAGGAARAEFFKYEDKLYILCDTGYYRYDGTDLESVEGYVPLISVSTTPDGSGTSYEAVNMLTPLRRQLFSPNGSDACFQLAEKNIRQVEKVMLDGETVDPSGYAADAVNGTVTLNDVPYAGVNTLEITYSAQSSARADFLKYKSAMLFGSDSDERVFLWNNADKPCMRIHSELADGVPSAEYFPVTNYTSVGSAPITDMVQEYGKQLIFTADSAYYSYCEMKTMPSGKTLASFPVYPLHARKGNLIKASGCCVNGMAVTLCRDGINVWRPTSVETEKNAVSISGAVNDVILPETRGTVSSARIFDVPSQSELYVLCASRAAIYNYAAKTWYCAESIPSAKIFEAFGTVYSVEGRRIMRFTASVRSHAASYKTHFTDLGSSSLKDIRFVNLTVEAGYSTAGSVKLTWTSEGGAHSEEKSFSVAQALHGSVTEIGLPFYIPHTAGITLEFKCPAGKELKLLGYGVTYEDKGVNYGL